MGKEVLMSGETEIGENKFYCNKNPIYLKNVDIEKVIVSDKISCGERNCK